MTWRRARWCMCPSTPSIMTPMPGTILRSSSRCVCPAKSYLCCTRCLGSFTLRLQVAKLSKTCPQQQLGTENCGSLQDQACLGVMNFCRASERGTSSHAAQHLATCCSHAHMPAKLCALMSWLVAHLQHLLFRHADLSCRSTGFAVNR